MKPPTATLTAVVTGTTGFIGTHLTRALLKQEWKVYSILRKNSTLAPDLAKNEHLHPLHYDGSTEDLVEKLRLVEKDAVIFHLASCFLAQHQTKDIETLVRSNVLFGTQLLEAMSVCGQTHLINTGTNWQHYDNADYNPVCLYAATKQAFETLMRYYVEADNFSAITLKLYDVYGPHDPRPKLFSLFQKTARERRPLLMSPGEQLLDLVYIDDVINAFLIAAERLRKATPGTSEEYAISSGHPLPLQEIASIYTQTTGYSLPIEWGGRPYRKREVMRPWNRGLALPGWQPHIPLAEGIRRLMTE
jgi:nucleoside-diphosphate-sugar epimerase